MLGKIKENISRIEKAVSMADFDLLVIPELASSGYLFTSKEEVAEAAENPLTGDFCKTLKKLSKEKNAHIVSGFCEKGSNNEYYNSSILVCPDGSFSIYRKIHLFNEEKFLFNKGNLPFETTKISGRGYRNVIIGMMICFDWIFPEAARTLALKGAQIICHPSNLVMPYCQKAMYARAIENHVFIITANRTGIDQKEEKNIKFTGSSVMIDPKGKYLHTADNDSEEIFITEIDPARALNKFINDNNSVIEDRRTKFYFSN